MTLHINKRSYLLEELKKKMDFDFDKAWDATEKLGEDEYKYLLMLIYKDEVEILKQEVKEKLNV